jgi:hypothetical protein
LRVRIGAARGEQFVLCVEQVEQAALADVELLAVGVARLLDRQHVAVQRFELLGELARVVEGDRRALARVAASLVTQVGGLVHDVGGLTDARPVAAAVVEVPFQHDFGAGVAPLVGDAVQMAARAAAQARLHARLPGAAFASFRTGACGAQRLDGRTDRRAGLHCGVAGVGGAGGQAGVGRRRLRHARRRQFADDARITRRHVVQVRGLGDEIALGQREAGVGLFEVDTAAHTCAHPASNLARRDLVLHVVVLGQRHPRQPDHHAGTRGGTLRQLERQTALHQRQAGGQRRARCALAMQPHHLDQAGEQRVGVQQVVPKATRGRSWRQSWAGRQPISAVCSRN